jgi:hypothetical protein
MEREEGGRMLHWPCMPIGPVRSVVLHRLGRRGPAGRAPEAQSPARRAPDPIDVAVAWQRASAGDWMTYAADVSRRDTITAGPAADHSP